MGKDYGKGAHRSGFFSHTQSIRGVTINFQQFSKQVILPEKREGYFKTKAIS